MVVPSVAELSSSIDSVKTTVEEKKASFEEKINKIKTKYNTVVGKINSVIYELEGYVNKAINAIVKGIKGALTWISDKIRACIRRIEKIIDNWNKFIEEKKKQLEELYNSTMDKTKVKLLKTLFTKIGMSVSESEKTADSIKSMVPTPELPIPKLTIDFPGPFPILESIFNMDFSSFIPGDAKDVKPVDLPKLPMI